MAATLDQTRKAIELEQLTDKANRYRTAALALYGPLKIMVASMPDNAAGTVWRHRIKQFRNAFDIQY